MSKFISISLHSDKKVVRINIDHIAWYASPQNQTDVTDLKLSNGDGFKVDGSAAKITMAINESLRQAD